MDRDQLFFNFNFIWVDLRFEEEKEVLKDIFEGKTMVSIVKRAFFFSQNVLRKKGIQ